MKTMVL